MSGHTPGPWCAAVRTSDGNGWSSDAQSVSITAGRLLIAEYRTTYVEYPDDETNAANARLISAAPELLNSLQWAMTQITYIHRIRGQNDAHCDAVDAARAAIAKATGEKQ